MSHDIRVYRKYQANAPGRPGGHFEYQAKCKTCSHVGPARKSPDTAREDVIAHKHIADNYTRGGSNWAGLHRRGEI